MSENFSWNELKDTALTIKESFIEGDHNSEVSIEAWKRIFVSRIYYYCYHNAVEVAEEITNYKKVPDELEFVYDIYNAHGGVRNFYFKLAKEYQMPGAIKSFSGKIATDLKSLHNLRKDCDYVLNIKNIDFNYNRSQILHSKIEDNIAKVQSHFRSKFSKRKKK